jgi:hypothetical protein
MENARPSSLRGDTSPSFDRGFSRLFVLRRRPVLPYLKVAAVSAGKIVWIIWTLAARLARF